MEENEKYYHPGVERLRLILMFFLCVELFGFPTILGDWLQTMCGFVPIAFFILSGYLVLREDADRSQRILRTIKRTAIVFGILTVVYFVLNLIYYRFFGADIFATLASKRLWFNFLVLNVWPFDIGSAIWYVQALLYAYIILYFLEKKKLLKYDWLIALVLIVFTVVTGELAGLFPWNLLGYEFIPGDFLTRALPYTLLGCFLHRKLDWFLKIRSLIFWCMIPFGFLLIGGEVIVLGMLGIPGYYGHLIGMAVIAVAACVLTFKRMDHTGFEKDLGMSRWHTNCIYYLAHPVGVGVAFVLSGLNAEALGPATPYIGIVTFGICFILAWLPAFIPRVIREAAHWLAWRFGKKHHGY